jgi:hypothetical protein
MNRQIGYLPIGRRILFVTGFYETGPIKPGVKELAYILQ